MTNNVLMKRFVTTLIVVGTIVLAGILAMQPADAACTLNAQQVIAAKNQGKLIVHDPNWQNGVVRLTNNTGCAVPIQLLSFRVHTEPVPGQPFGEQTLFAKQNIVIPAGQTRAVSVPLPGCRFQIDLVYPETSHGIWGRITWGRALCPRDTAPTPAPQPTATPAACQANCATDVGINQQSTIIAGGNVQSSQEIVGQKTEQTIINNVTDDDEDSDKPVTLLKTDGRDVVRAGEVITYRIVIRNPKNEDLTQVKIVDRVPPYLTPISTSPAGRADAASRTITWDNQTISAKAEVTFAIRARVAHNTPNGFLLQNTAEVNGPGLRLNAVDSSTVNAPQIASAVTSAPAPVQRVPVTAQTGTPLDTASLLLSLVGSASTAGTLLLKRFI